MCFPLSVSQVKQYVPLIQPSLPFRYGFLYINWGLTQAALILENVTNITWEQHVTDLILQPLGMANTTTSVQASLSRNRATPYTAGASSTDSPRALPVEVDAWVDLYAPAGAIHSTANDMSKWLLFQLGSHPQFINQSTLDYLHTAVVPTTSPITPFDQRGYITAANPNSSLVTVGYGFNWLERVWDGHVAVWHNGGLFGFVSDLWIIPLDSFGWWIGTPAVSTVAFDSVREWIVAEMLGEYNAADALCLSQSSAADDVMSRDEETVRPAALFDEWHGRARASGRSFMSTAPFTSTAASMSRSPSQTTAQLNPNAIEPSQLIGMYIDVVGPWGVVNVCTMATTPHTRCC